MSRRGARRAAVVFAMTLVCACSNKPPEDPKSYVAEIAAARASKDEAFKSGSDSPVPENRRAELCRSRTSPSSRSTRRLQF